MNPLTTSLASVLLVVPTLTAHASQFTVEVGDLDDFNGLCVGGSDSGPTAASASSPFSPPAAGSDTGPPASLPDRHDPA